MNKGKRLNGVLSFAMRWGRGEKRNVSIGKSTSNRNKRRRQQMLTPFTSKLLVPGKKATPATENTERGQKPQNRFGNKVFNSENISRELNCTKCCWSQTKLHVENKQFVEAWNRNFRSGDEVSRYNDFESRVGEASKVLQPRFACHTHIEA